MTHQEPRQLAPLHPEAEQEYDENEGQPKSPTASVPAPSLTFSSLSSHDSLPLGCEHKEYFWIKRYRALKRRVSTSSKKNGETCESIIEEEDAEEAVRSCENILIEEEDAEGGEKYRVFVFS